MSLYRCTDASHSQFHFLHIYSCDTAVIAEKGKEGGYFVLGIIERHIRDTTKGDGLCAAR